MPIKGLLRITNPRCFVEQAVRRLVVEGAQNVLIDAGGMEYAPADFKRFFIEPGPIGT
jgi:hypothetical protein